MFNYCRLLHTVLKNKLGVVSYPLFVTYILTWRCNAKCIMCDIWKKDKGDELSLGQIQDIFKQLKSLDAIRITGGEPFARNDIVDIINIIQEANRPRYIHITTNGLLKENIIDSFARIKKTKNIHIKISINAFGQEHDKIMGFDGAFEIALGTLVELVKLRERYQFFIGVNQTISSKESLHCYNKLKEICYNYKVDLLPVFAYAKTALYAQENNLDMMPKKKGEFDIFTNFSKKELEEALKEFINDVSMISNPIEKLIKRYYLKGAYNRLINDSACPCPRCIALNNHLRILPNGDVPICLYNSQIVGNLGKQSFSDVWFGKTIEENRKKVNNCPICWAGCEIIPNAIYTADIMKSFFN